MNHETDQSSEPARVPARRLARALVGRIAIDGAEQTAAATIPRRPLGRTGVRGVDASGSAAITSARREDQNEAKRIVDAAIDAGINFFDNAWEYHDGESEEWLGRRSKGKRDRVFLMTKVCTHGRDKNVAMRMLEESLRRLQTDHLDLWQIHEVIYDNDPDLIFAPNGAAEALTQAKKEGKVRFVGFTGPQGSGDPPADAVARLSRSTRCRCR